MLNCSYLIYKALFRGPQSTFICWDSNLRALREPPEHSAHLYTVPAEFLDELLGSGGDVAREVDGVDALQDDVVGLHGVGAGEGGRSGEQLEHEDPE